MSSKTKPSIDDVMKMPVRRSVARRLPWLLIGLIGGILASEIVNNFEKTLSENLILAAFIPLIVYMSDAVGTQMESFVIRDIALHTRMHFFRYLLKQIQVVLVMAVVLAFALFGFSYVIHGDFHLGIVLSISLFVSIMSSVVTGLVLPRIFQAYRLDPANASGPTATIIQDILSVSIYFLVASSLL